MSIKASFDGVVADMTRDYPCLKVDDFGNIVLIKDSQCATIVFSKREENIGTQYSNGEYSRNTANLKPFEGTLTLSNSKSIVDVEKE